MLSSVVDLLNTFWLSFKRFLQGNSIMVTTEEENRRMNTCLECVYIRGNKKKNYRCKLCKCYLVFKVNTIDSKCPIGKW